MAKKKKKDFLIIPVAFIYWHNKYSEGLLCADTVLELGKEP